MESCPDRATVGYGVGVCLKLSETVGTGAVEVGKSSTTLGFAAAP